MSKSKKADAPPESSADAPQWDYETRDEKSALIEQLRKLEPHLLDGQDGAWIKVDDLDAAIRASMEAPKESE